jgi:predicted DNA binding CopG/RHH family protein
MTIITTSDFNAKFNADSDKWDSGELGRDEAHVQIAPKSASTDDALGLQMISIRLPKDLIETFKLIGAMHGVGYQPLMRTTLQRFADSELKMFGKDYMTKIIAQSKVQQTEAEPLRMAA